MRIIRRKNKRLSGYTFIDLFAGIGGFRIALESFGAECVFSSEWDKAAQDVYEKNFGERPYGDITKIKAEDIPKFNILTGGFPCQPFSISGKQSGFEDARGTLFFEILRLIKYHKPKFFILENVKNFETHDSGKTLNVVKTSLENEHYTVFCKVLNAGDFGIPQKRERIFIVGFQKSLEIKKFSFPEQLKKFKTLNDILSNCDNYINRTDIEITNNDYIPKTRKPVRIGTVGKGGQGERIYHPNGQAITLSAYGGGVGSKTGLYLINNKIRKLTPRECADVMGFPKSFKLHSNPLQCYKQFGNSVVIDVLQYIIEEIIKYLPDRVVECR